MGSTPLLLSITGQLWPGVVAPDSVLSMELIELASNTWSFSFQNVITKMRLQIIYEDH